MSDLFKKRFAELQLQMEQLLASQKSTFNGFLQKNQVEIDGNLLLEWIVKTRSLIGKACGVESEHYKEFSDNDTTGAYGTYLSTLESLRAVFLAAKEDYEGGYLKTTRSLIQADVFDSELEQATSLIDTGYKLPAAVVAGVVLETALRDLCKQEGLPEGKLDKMNSDLANVGKYNVLQQKRITALADIRNAAAHGKLDSFTDQDVKDMIRDVERFLSEHL